MDVESQCLGDDDGEIMAGRNLLGGHDNDKEEETMIRIVIVTMRRVMGNIIASKMEVAPRYTLLTLLTLLTMLTRFILFSFQNVGWTGKCC